MQVEIKDNIIEYRTNPTILSVLELLPKANRQVRVNKLVVTGNGIERNSKSIDVKEDIREFTKIFKTKENHIKWYNLGVTAIKVLGYITENIEPDATNIFIMSSKFCSATGLSRSSLSIGLKELIDKNWLYKSINPKEYFINLHYFFNGKIENVHIKYEETIPI